MGRKKIEKDPKPDSKSKVEEQKPETHKPKKTGKSKGKVSTDALFSDGFNTSVDKFSTFYSDYLDARGQTSDADSTQNLESILENVASDLEKACKQVLRKHVVDSQHWIENQQKAVQKQIQATNEAEASTRNALSAAKTFSESEIDTQVSAIRQKGKKLQQHLHQFEALQERAQKIYHTDKMEQE